jgi:NADH:ubiquinone oxidoreductase subunit 6 (subunit J)
MQLFLLIAVVAFSILAILLRDLLKSAISLAVSSLFLAILFFRMGAYYVGVFEISVVAGLITVLFIATIAMTRGDADVRERKWPVLAFPVFFIAFILADVVIMKALVGKIPVLPGGAERGGFSQVLWGQRTFDLVGQIGVIFAGVFAVLALFRKGGKNG